jgi:AraC-like DNA-binding protein
MMQIAQEIGYANDIGFIRVFKKLEGITPGKYREMIRSSGTRRIHATSGEQPDLHLVDGSRGHHVYYS